MPAGWWETVALLAAGYLLLALELVVPGGVVGALGGLLVVFGCWRAFGLGTGWGVGAVTGSLVVAWLLATLFLRSRASRRLRLEQGEGGWRAPAATLAELVGARGRALTPLRPSGTAEIGELRVDVVTDGEYVETGRPLSVVAVEGSRVIVEEEVGAESPDVAPPESEDGAAAPGEER